MPYINQTDRDRLDPFIDQLARNIVDICCDVEVWQADAFAGMLNYACTSLAIKILDSTVGRVRYGTIATITGVFSNVASEFYRRVAAPYEDLKIEQSGDVPLYEKYGKRQ
jgi:hypothetical protein